MPDRDGVFKKNTRMLDMAQKLKSIDKNHKDLSIRQQCSLLELTRAMLYYLRVQSFYPHSVLQNILYSKQNSKFSTDIVL